MSLKKILTFPDPILREVSSDVQTFDENLQILVEDMLETMYAANGIGLAAPQIGVLQRVVVIDTRQKDEEGARYHYEEMTELEKSISQPMVLINPKVIQGEGKTTYEEGCLSVPGFYETVERYQKIEVSTLDVMGKEIRFQADGLLAICIQHEMDHLMGKLFIDRLSFIKSSKIKNQIVKNGYPPRKKEDKTHKGL